MCERTKAVFLSLFCGEVVCVLSGPSWLQGPKGYWLYPHIEEGLGGAPAAWSARLATREEYEPLKARLEVDAGELEVCTAVPDDLFA